MGFFDRLVNVFNLFFGNTQSVAFDDKRVISSIRKYPQSLSDNYKNSLNEIADNIHQVYEAANNKEFTIGVIGDFTVGKSSFINAILGDTILPVSANPTTAIITRIKYGIKPRVIVRYKDGNEEEMSYDTFMKFSAYNLNDFQERMSDGDILRFKNVVDATMYVESEFLKDNNLCIVDTLGLSEDESDNKKTITSIRDSIAMIYICGERGLSERDEAFISAYLSPENNDFFLCINRIDLVNKCERDNFSQVVKLRMDNILRKAGHTKEFPLNRIYQVSSLYQEFANGYTNHIDYCEGVNYRERSGFMRIMNDVGKYVKVNEDESRKKAINKQLLKSQVQLNELMTLRKSELDGIIDNNKSKIINIKEEAKRNQEAIASVNLLFERLYNEIYSFSNNLYSDFSQSVNNSWEKQLEEDLVNKVSFGVGDYLTLKKDILALKLNVFKSMNDYQFAKLESLSPFVNLTIQFLIDKLTPIVDHLETQIKSTIDRFVEENNFQDYFNGELYFVNGVCHFATQSELVNSIYRVVAIAATESTWMTNSKRRIIMLNAAKTELLKLVVTPLNKKREEIYSKIQDFLNASKTNVTKSNIMNISNLTQQLKDLENQNSSIRRQIDCEKSYFNKSIELLSLSLYNESGSNGNMN